MPGTCSGYIMVERTTIDRKISGNIKILSNKMFPNIKLLTQLLTS